MPLKPSCVSNKLQRMFLAELTSLTRLTHCSSHPPTNAFAHETVQHAFEQGMPQKDHFHQSRHSLTTDVLAKHTRCQHRRRMRRAAGRRINCAACCEVESRCNCERQCSFTTSIVSTPNPSNSRQGSMVAPLTRACAALMPPRHTCSYTLLPIEVTDSQVRVGSMSARGYRRQACTYPCAPCSVTAQDAHPIPLHGTV